MFIVQTIDLCVQWLCIMCILFKLNMCTYWNLNLYLVDTQLERNILLLRLLKPDSPILLLKFWRIVVFGRKPKGSASCCDYLKSWILLTSARSSVAFWTDPTLPSSTLGLELKVNCKCNVQFTTRVEPGSLFILEKFAFSSWMILNLVRLPSEWSDSNQGPIYALFWLFGHACWPQIHSNSTDGLCILLKLNRKKMMQKTSEDDLLLGSPNAVLYYTCGFPNSRIQIVKETRFTVGKYRKLERSLSGGEKLPNFRSMSAFCLLAARHWVLSSRTFPHLSELSKNSNFSTTHQEQATIQSSAQVVAKLT